MEILIFAKRRKTSEGKTFNAYITTLITKNNEPHTMGVKFREICQAPRAEECPMYINVDRKDANIATKTYEREDTGETAIAKTLWISAWEKSDKEYVDTSLDEYI